MRYTFQTVAAGAVLALSIAGCKKIADNSINYKNAINAYYETHPSCLWPDPVKFPAQAGTSDDSKTSQYDTLYDAGLLTRTTAEKKVLIIATKQVTNYDLSDKGRSSWTPDPTQPGYGNFCYGHRAVQSIDTATPNSGQPGAATQVSYLYSFVGAPDWAKSPETQNTFPETATEVSGHGGATATLVDTDNGWQMKPPPAHHASDADGKIVE